MQQNLQTTQPREHEAECTGLQRHGKKSRKSRGSDSERTHSTTTFRNGRCVGIGIGGGLLFRLGAFFRRGLFHGSFVSGIGSGIDVLDLANGHRLGLRPVLGANELRHGLRPIVKLRHGSRGRSASDPQPRQNGAQKPQLAALRHRRHAVVELLVGRVGRGAASVHRRANPVQAERGQVGRRPRARSRQGAAVADGGIGALVDLQSRHVDALDGHAEEAGQGVEAAPVGRGRAARRGVAAGEAFGEGGEVGGPGGEVEGGGVDAVGELGEGVLDFFGGHVGGVDAGGGCGGGEFFGGHFDEVAEEGVAGRGSGGGEEQGEEGLADLHGDCLVLNSLIAYIECERCLVRVVLGATIVIFMRFSNPICNNTQCVSCCFIYNVRNLLGFG
ncbi:hypothetical protein ACHAXS_002636 [Conticribra weissflogii]